MPETEWHIAESLRKTGTPHRAVHRFADHGTRKPERHDITRLVDFCRLIESRHGAEAAQEFIQHIHDDLQAKLHGFVAALKSRASELSASAAAGTPAADLLNTLVAQTEARIGEILAYFGIAPGKQVRLYRISEDDVELLRRVGVSAEDVGHCRAVAEKALEIALRGEPAALDLEWIGRGALFHDLGKARTHAIEHGRIGAEIGKTLGLPAAITDLMEKHIRGGLSEQEAVELGLPAKDYRPHRLEERIVIYADRLVDIITDGVADDEGAERDFEEILSSRIRYGKNEATRERYLQYHREIQAWMGGRCA